MSSSTNTEPISGIWWISQATHCVVASACILAYDILITGDREVACIWNRKFSGVTVIFVNIRYVTLISQIAWVAFLTQPGVYLPCKITYFILFSASIWVSVVSAVFNTLRIWAIWGRHWGILAVGLPINLLPAALNLCTVAWLHITSSPFPRHIGGCGVSYSIPTDTLTRLTIASRACAIVADAMILAAMWMKTWSIHQVMKSTRIDAGQPKVSLSGLLIRDGTIYFVVLLCLNICMLVLTTIPQAFIFDPFSMDSITAILLCRLILNLRSYDTEYVSSIALSAKQMSSVHFANAVLGNIGASVPTSDRDDPDALEHDTTYWQGNTESDGVVNDPLDMGVRGQARHTKCHSYNEDGLV